MIMKRSAIGLVTTAAVIALAGGPALAAGSSPQIFSRPTSTPPCTDSWVGNGSNASWTVASNWSTGKVPGPSSDVCITADGVDVQTPVSITVNSLLLGDEEGIALEGTSTTPVTAKVATEVELTPGVISRIDMTDATVEAAEIDVDGGTIYTDGTSELDSPDTAFTDGGLLDANGGTVTLTGLPQLSDGTLIGGTFDAFGGVIVVPGDITSLVGTTVDVVEHSAIDDPSGDNALTGLTSVDAQSTFTDDNDLPLTGSLVDDGNVSFGGPAVSLVGTLTQAQGTLVVETNLSASEVLVDKGATLEADEATIAGDDLVNNGIVETGGPATVTGDYAQSKDAELAVAFGYPLVVDGSASLAGTVFSGEAIPSAGDTTQLIAFGSVSGAFSHHNPGFIEVTKTQDIEAIIEPQIDVSPEKVSPTTLVTVTGGSFTGGPVDLYLDSTTGTPVATAAVGYFGRFSVSFTLPAGVTPGLHQIIAVLPGVRATRLIRVT
jgi:hypothetical protein